MRLLYSKKNRLRAINIIFLLLAFAHFANAQIALPNGVARFPQSLGTLADSSFYQGYAPMYSTVNFENDSSGNKQNIFILALSRITDFPSHTESFRDHKKVVYKTQASLLSGTKAGVFPRWELFFPDNTSDQPFKNFGALRYHPEYGIYTVMKQDPETKKDRGSLLILDSTFHQIDFLHGVIFNTHDYQLLKLPNGNWNIITCAENPPTYFDSLDMNYEINSWEYEHSELKRQLWKCGPTVKTIDSAEWVTIATGCAAHPGMFNNLTGYNGPHDMFHENSAQAFPWSKDSLLVAISEQNTNKIRFWWIVDSSGISVTRGMFRFGSVTDFYSDFTFPDNPDFKINKGHSFSILGKYQNTIFASFFDNEVCNSDLSARGLILSIDLYKRECKLLQQNTDGCRSVAAGNMHVMLSQTPPATPTSILNANRCINWGMPDPGNLPGCFETTVMNPAGKTIVGITVTDLEYHKYHPMVNSDYQSQAWYQLPIPSRPITYTIKGDSVILKTNFVSPTWITGATTSTITLPIHKKGEPVVTIWVRGKTDETMVGELWENINLPSK